MLPAKIFVTILLMGSIPMWIRMVHGSPAEIGTVRLAWGLGLTLLFMARRVDFRAVLRGSPDAGVPFYLLPVIGLCFGAHWFLYFTSIQLSSASLGILALSTYGVHVTWMGAVFSSRHTGARDWVAVTCSALGAFICAPPFDAGHHAFLGFMAGMLSAVFYAALPLLHQRAQGLSLPTRSTAQFFFAGLVFAPVAATQRWELDTRSWVALTVLGVLCTFVAHNLWIEVTTAVRPATSGVLYYLAVPVTLLLDTLVRTTHPCWRSGRAPRSCSPATAARGGPRASAACRSRTARLASRPRVADGDGGRDDRATSGPQWPQGRSWRRW